MKVSQIFAKATIIALMILKLDGRMGTYTDLLAKHICEFAIQNFSGVKNNHFNTKMFQVLSRVYM
jgi:hypothetical protein